ncbi:PIN domain-containing protein [Candidatus Synechococcus spongiarum]|uniref:PIN domain-containing protein n=1 Tax=Candidatus Synechococcus spongiarum TaxID=431041 RepID=UPI0034D62AA6
MHRLFLPSFSVKQGATGWMISSKIQIVSPAASTGQRWFKKFVRKAQSPFSARFLQSFLTTYPLKVEQVTIEDGQRAAELWRQGTPLSLADRFCLALGQRLRIPVVTADKEWSKVDVAIRVIQIRD